ncbi:flavodoxin family protein [Marinomonas piezotolerans]|uniref:Flavodoxin family protein n=1 Tax=Marinomonas piezotolerans TaxID=2213058 RepID=A0A370UDI2_9GAMM|nr:NAD(P)H-dependent oxidoreductase [Marinomonas piezotolerans]RDL45819.1 flavodoxin family protein [Marinomonas piezotolerans]
MSKVLVINANPKNNSLCQAFADRYAMSASDKHDVKQINIADMSFELSLEQGYDKTQPLEPDLRHFQESLVWSDHIVIVTPVWWGSMPAKLKGLFDRSFLPNFAFKYIQGKSQPEKLLKGRTSELIITLDTPPIWYRYVQGDVIRKQLNTTILGFSGIKNKSTTYFGPVLSASDTKRKGWLDTIGQLPKRIRQ